MRLGLPRQHWGSRGHGDQAPRRGSQAGTGHHQGAHGAGTTLGLGDQGPVAWESGCIWGPGNTRRGEQPGTGPQGPQCWDQVGPKTRGPWGVLGTRVDPGVAGPQKTGGSRCAVALYMVCDTSLDPHFNAKRSASQHAHFYQDNVVGISTFIRSPPPHTLDPPPPSPGRTVRVGCCTSCF